MTTIKRKILVKLYNEFTCSDWKNRISPYLIENTNDTIEIKREDVLYAIKNASTEQKAAIQKAGVSLDQNTHLAGLNSYEDACKILGEKPKASPSLAAQIKKIIKAANFLDNGNKIWKANFKDNNQYKYMAYHILSGSGWVFRAVGDWGSFPGCPVGFYFMNSDTCEFITKKFYPLYKQYLTEEEE